MRVEQLVVEALRAEKEREQLTNSELARRLHIHEATLYEWLAGKISKNSKQLIDLVVRNTPQNHRDISNIGA